MSGRSHRRRRAGRRSCRRPSEVFGGPIDILVNNAAAAIYQPLIDFPLKRRRLIFEVNVHAPMDLAQAVLPGMIERGEGWIVNVSSATAHLVGATVRAGLAWARPLGSTARPRRRSTGSQTPGRRSRVVRESASIPSSRVRRS